MDSTEIITETPKIKPRTGTERYRNIFKRLFCAESGAGNKNENSQSNASAKLRKCEGEQCENEEESSLRSTSTYTKEDDWVDKFFQPVIINEVEAEKHNMRAKMCLDLKDYKNAIRHYRLASKLNPLVGKYLTMKAFCYLKLGKFDKCMQHCTTAIEMNPLDVNAHRIRMIAVEYSKGEHFVYRDAWMLEQVCDAKTTEALKPKPSDEPPLPKRSKRSNYLQRRDSKEKLKKLLGAVTKKDEAEKDLKCSKKQSEESIDKPIESTYGSVKIIPIENDVSPIPPTNEIADDLEQIADEEEAQEQKTTAVELNEDE